MKRKIITIALAMVLGVSVFGGSAQAAVAQEASVSGCSHPSLSIVENSRVFVGYEQASGIFHNRVYRITYECDTPNCTHKVYDYEYEWEDHVFNDYRDGHCYCSLCGEEDEFYRP